MSSFHTRSRRFAGRAGRILITLVTASGSLALGARPALTATASPTDPVQVWKRPLTTLAAVESSPVAADLDRNGSVDIAFGTIDGWVHALKGADGGDVAGWPQKTTDSIASSPAVADTDGDGNPELFVGSGDHASPGGALYSYDHNGSLRFRYQASDPHKASLAIHATPALGDVNADGTPDATFGALGLKAWSLSQSGGVNAGWPYYTDDTTFSSAALVDVNGDGSTDVVVGGDSTAGGPIDHKGGLVRALTGSGQLLWEFRINDIVRSSPSVGDIDGDGRAEIVFGAGNFYQASDSTKVFALDLSGRLKPGWPKQTDGWTQGSPAIADVNGDGRLDVAMGTWRPEGHGSVYAWSGDGGQLPGFPQGITSGPVLGSVVTADFNGDGAQDILVPTTRGAWAFNGRNGALLFKLADLKISLQNSPAVTDADGDGLLDIFIAGEDNERPGKAVAYRFEVPAAAGGKMGAGAWPMFRRDAQRSGSWSDVPLSRSFCNSPGAGYWLTAADGGIFAFCEARFHGSTGSIKLAQPIVGMTPTLSGNGYWLVARDGGLFAFGDAGFFGSTGDIKLARPIVGMTPTPSGRGYWMVASDGGVFAFGDAGFFGSTGDIKLAQPIVGMTPTPSGRGYWIVASDGGIFAFGDATFLGSTGGTKLVKPIVGMATSRNGYWLVASDGGIFAFGDAAFLGSTGHLRLAQPIVGMSKTSSGNGYWMVASDGGIFAFGDAQFAGSTGGIRLAQPIVGMAVPNFR
jgi:hypothetical protein